MKSTIHLFNTALGRLGGEQLPLNRSPHEDDSVGTLCENLFPHVLELALTAHEWGFAKKRAVLALLPGQEPRNPAYALRYALPADCLKPVRINGHGQNAGAALGAFVDIPENFELAYILEGESLLTNIEQAELLYIARVEDPKQWPTGFADALAWGLAGELASARLNDARRQQMCYQNYEIALTKACAQDRAQQNPLKKLSPWQLARGTGPARAAYRGAR